MRTVSIDAAKRMALAAQGFAQGRAMGRVDVRHFRRVMDRVGLVQLDSVNVCVRSHYMPFYSRIGPYDQQALDTWLNTSGENFEYWAHAAAVMPIGKYPLWRWKMDEGISWRRAEVILAKYPGLLEDVKRQVHERGPLTVSDLDAPKRRNDLWWGYGPGKVALEVLFASGDIAALRTKTFGRLYDDPARMIDAGVFNASPVAKEEAYRLLLREAVEHVGIGTVHDVADYFRLGMSRSATILERLAASGAIEEVHITGWNGPVYMDPDAVRPRVIRGTTLLSPFDPITWYRERALRLFGFDYRIEIYVPEPKREFGYYSLPLLMDGELVGRVDLKAERKTGTLLVQSAWHEETADCARVADSLAKELEVFAQWLGLDSIKLADRGNVIGALARFL